MRDVSISLVIPVYNEAEIIEETIFIFLEQLRSIADNFEIIVVDDGSIDGTADILRRLASKNRNLKILYNKENIGSGASLWKGFKEAKNEFVISNFADRPFDLNEFLNILQLFDAQIDFVIVGREDRSANTFFRKITSIINYILVRFLFGIKVKDFQFVQVYRKKILDNIEVVSKHTFAAPEIIIRLISLGHKYKEYKSKFYPRPKGKSKYSKPALIIKSSLELLRFFLNWEVLNQKTHL